VITSLAGALVPPSLSVTVNGDRDRAVEVRGGREDEVGGLGGGDRRARHDRRRAVGQIEHAFACRWQAGDRDRRNRAVDVGADRLTAMSVSSLPDEVEAVAVGRSLTSVTVSVTVAVTSACRR
jgi:hypothetical protein